MTATSETFRLIRRCNDWNLRGEPINVVETVELETADLEAAFRLQAALDSRGLWAAARAVNFRVVDAAGDRVEFSELYRRVVGDELFQQQLADENFSINLDDWLRDRVAADVDKAIEAAAARDAAALEAELPVKFFIRNLELARNVMRNAKHVDLTPTHHYYGTLELYDVDPELDDEQQERLGIVPYCDDLADWDNHCAAVYRAESRIGA